MSFLKADLVELAIACGIDPNRTSGQGEKTKAELCADIENAIRNVEHPVAPAKVLKHAQPEPILPVKSVKKTISGECSVTENCPTGYRRDDLVKIAKKCGIDIQRAPPKKGPKNMDELCQEILALGGIAIKSAPKPKKVAEKVPSKITQNQLWDTIVTLRDNINTTQDSERSQYGNSPFYLRLNNLNAEIGEVRELFKPIKVRTSIPGEFRLEPRTISQEQLDVIEVVVTELNKTFQNIKEEIRKLEPERAKLLKRKSILMNSVELLYMDIVRIAGQEIQKFGESEFKSSLESLLPNIRQIFFSVNFGIDQQEIIKREQALSEIKAKFETINREIQRLGRRCANNIAPISLDPVDEIPEEDWVRLSNGACWDIVTLIDYIKQTTNGQNTATAIKQFMPEYPSNKIWENDADYRKIVEHPKARQAELHDFIQSRKIGDLARRISDNTMRMLFTSGSKLWSRGPPFEEALREQMNPRQLRVWNEAKQGLRPMELPGYIAGARPGTIEEEILNIINGVIKSDAISTLHRYLQAVPADEKQALHDLKPNLYSTVDDCYAERECVMVMGAMLLKLYNKIVPHKAGFRKFDAPELE